MEEAKLAERAREGDRAAYERLVRMHQAVAFRAAYLVTSDAPEAEDAPQEAFIKAYRALDRFRPGAPFRPWPGEREAATACPSPSIEAVPARAAAGAKFRLCGHDFSSGCDGVTPARDVGIFFRQDGKTRQLTTLDADHALTFDTALRVPKNAEPGRAAVLANLRSGERVEERFVVLR